jgi:nucleotide-binding universal stress UspA family protein
MKRVNIDRILCPIDFSDPSRDALAEAVALATWYDATVTLLHILEIPQVSIDTLAAGTDVLGPLLDRDKLAADLRSFAEPVIGTAGIRTDVLVRVGVPAAAIERQAEWMHADLVVVGSHGRSGFKRFLLGSVTERLLRAITVPLLIVPRSVNTAQQARYDTILCPIDFSDESLRALDYGLSVAQESNARIILLHVLEGVLDEVDPQQILNVNVIEYLRNLEQDATTRLHAAVPDEARLWAHPVERIARGRAYQQILSIADVENVGLIVMGVRGRGALNRLIFGSTTEHVIREAHCPVLTLHAVVPTDRVERSLQDENIHSPRRSDDVVRGVEP